MRNDTICLPYPLRQLEQLHECRRLVCEPEQFPGQREQERVSSYLTHTIYFLVAAVFGLPLESLILKGIKMLTRNREYYPLLFGRKYNRVIIKAIKPKFYR